MMGHTHILGGCAAWLAGCAAMPVLAGPLTARVIILGLPVAAAASLAPDIDHRRSEVTKALGPLGWIGFQLTRPRCGGNRGIMHSRVIFAALAVGLLVAWFLRAVPAWVAWAAVAGWASHIVLDMATREGVRWDWPSRRRFGWLPKAQSMRTGGPGRKPGQRRGLEYKLVQPVLLLAVFGLAWLIVRGVR